MQKFIKKTLAGEKLDEADITLYHSGERILHTQASPLLDSVEKRIGMLVVLNDVTQLRSLENIRKDFAANVSMK